MWFLSPSHPESLSLPPLPRMRGWWVVPPVRRAGWEVKEIVSGYLSQDLKKGCRSRGHGKIGTVWRREWVMAVRIVVSEQWKGQGVVDDARAPEP